MKNSILIVDRDPQVHATLDGLLNADYECLPFSDTVAAFSHLQASSVPIDLILLDLEEMVNTHFEMLKGIRVHYLYKDIPILVGVPPTHAAYITQTLQLGADDIIYKPLDTELARRRIFHLLSIGKMRKAHNVMEDLIELEIDRNIDVLSICPCPQCRRDLLTLTLNHTTPQYVSTEKGEAIVNAARKASRDDQIQLLASITRYAQLIRDNPRHG